MPEAPAARHWVDRFILPFVHESTLWPVLIVLVAHAAAFLAPLMIFAVREGAAGSASLLAGLGLLSAAVVRFEWRRQGRLAALTAVLTATWLLSVGMAWLADRTGLF